MNQTVPQQPAVIFFPYLILILDSFTCYNTCYKQTVECQKFDLCENGSVMYNNFACRGELVLGTSSLTKVYTN